MSDKLKGLAPCVHEDGSGDYWIIEYPNGREAYAQRKAPPSASENQLNPLEETLVLLCEHWNSRPRPATLDADVKSLINTLWQNNHMLHGALHGVSYGLGKDKDYAIKRLEQSKQTLDGVANQIKAINSGNLGAE